MVTNDLASLERRTYQTFDDGLADILLGGFLTVVGVIMSFELDVNVGLVSGLLAAAAFPAWRALRRAIAEPRVGYVRLLAARSRRVNLGQCVGAAAMAAIILYGVFFTDGGRDVDTWFPGLVFAIPLAVLGYFADLPRWYWYAAIIMLERLADSWSAGPSEWLFWPSGAIIAICGASALARFMQRYPRKNGGVPENT
jgi:hypothetical protein